MKKCSVILALVVSLLLPMTVFAQNASDGSRTHRSRSDSSNQASATNETSVQETAPVEESQPVEASESSESSSSAVDDRPHGTFSPEQLMLNNRAVEAVKEGNFKKGEQLYFALLQLGEFNVIWYQIARTYARENKCIEAYDAFNQVSKAPILDDEGFTPEAIAAFTETGLKELDAQCSSKVRFTCTPADTKLSIDGGVEFDCNSNEIKLVPGKHAVYARTSFGFNSITVSTSAGQVKDAKVEVVNYEDIALKGGMTVEELEKKSKIFKITGYTLLGAGIVGAGVSGGLMAYFNYDYLDKFDNQQNDTTEIQKLTDLREKRQKDLILTYSFLAVGGAMAVTGAVLLIVDAVKIQPQLEYLRGSASVFEVSPVVSPEFSGITLSGRF